MGRGTGGQIQKKKMDKIELCPICGNNHMGSCSSELTYFHWTPKEGEQVPGMVEVVGEWHRWQHHEQMSKESDDKGVVYFELGVSIPVGKYEYKFVVDGEWTCSDESPTVQNPYGSYNNVVEVLPKKALMEYIPRQDIKITSSIAARDLRIVGSWDGWKTEQRMELAYNNLKGCEENFIYLELIPNTTYEFKFRLGKQFLIDEKYPTVPNQFGTHNNRIFLYSEKMSTPTGWRTSKIISSTPITGRSFEWERVCIEEDFVEYNQTVDGHSMCQIGDYIYIFGGRVRDDFTNKLTKVNVHKLSQMSAEENMPNERAFHSAVSYGRKMIIYGGHNKGILQDYCVFDTTDNVWLPTPDIQGDFPSKREKQTCVLYEMLLVFFGGYYCSPDLEFEYSYNDIQVLDLEHMRWINDIQVTGDLPHPRYSQAASLVHSRMYIFGGMTIKADIKGQNSDVSLNFNDLWMLNLEKVSGLEWEKIETKGKPPTARHGHTMNTLQEFLVIFGGKAMQEKGGKGQKVRTEQSLNDVIVFDIEKREWVYPLLKTCTSLCEPTPRVFHGSTTVNNEYIVIFGGKTKNKVSSSVYVLKPKEIRPTLDIEEEDEDDEESNCMDMETRSNKLDLDNLTPSRSSKLERDNPTPDRIKLEPDSPTRRRMESPRGKSDFSEGLMCMSPSKNP